MHLWQFGLRRTEPREARKLLETFSVQTRRLDLRWPNTAKLATPNETEDKRARPRV